MYGPMPGKYLDIMFGQEILVISNATGYMLTSSGFALFT